MVSDVSVIALSCFIVIPKDALFIHDVCQAILVEMFRAWRREIKYPNDDFRKPVVCVFKASSNELCCFHKACSVAPGAGVVNTNNERAFCGA